MILVIFIWYGLLFRFGSAPDRLGEGRFTRLAFNMVAAGIASLPSAGMNMG